MVGEISQTTWIAASAIATLLLAIGTFAFVVAAFRQLPILRDSQRVASDSAEAATRAARAAEDAVEIQRAARHEQSIAALFPFLFLSFEGDDTDLSILLANRGDVPAVDVDLLVFAVYEDTEFPLDEFLSDWVTPGQRQSAEEVGVDQEGFWAVRDHLVYSYAPPRLQVAASVPLPLPPSSITTIIQARDVLGRNYVRSEWHYSIPGEDRYRSGKFGPLSLVELPRLGLDLELPESNSGDLAEDALSRLGEIQDAVGELRHRALSVGWIKGASADWEDRGTWGDI